MFKAVTVTTRGTPNAYIVGVFNDKKLDTTTKTFDPAIAEAIRRDECTGELGNIIETFAWNIDTETRIFVVGLGDRKNFKHTALRNIAGNLGRRLAQTKEQRVSIDLWNALKSIKKLDATRAGRAVGEGLGLIAWNVDTFKGSASSTPKRTTLAVSSPETSFTNGIKRGLALAQSTNVSRSLSETPPNIATTSHIANQAKALARKFPTLTCTVIKGDQLEKHALQGLINVGKASEHPPCLIRIEYKPTPHPKTSKPVVLVGKTMTYDSGGLSIKVGGSMKGMKHDKDGGCAIFGAMHAIASVVKPKTPVVALLACAENAISDEAYRPDDIITFRNGVTVEVTNTDAEGRLVLADALCWACDKEKPAAIIDMATLTGGVVVALGNTFAGLWCEDEKLRNKLNNAMETSGDRIWRLPHDQEYNDMMRSPIADILNSAPVRAAHPIQGAAFLSYFVDKDIPWAHIDIAGTNATDRDTGPYVRGATGFGVRLLADLVDQF